MGNRTCKINHGQQCEDERLDKGNKETEKHEDHRDKERNKGEEYGGNEVVTGYVAEKPYTQGHGPCNVTDKFDGAHENAQDNVGVPGHHIADEHELPEVFDPMFPQPVKMGEGEDCERTGEGRVYIVRRRQKSGDETRKVVEENEKGQRADDKHELRPPLTHIVFKEIPESLDDDLDKVPESEFLIGNDLIFQLFHLPVAEKNDEKKEDRNDDRIGYVRRHCFEKRYERHPGKSFMPHYLVSFVSWN